MQARNQFGSLLGLPEKARKIFWQLAEGASQPDLFHHTDSLTSAMEEAQTDNEHFLQSFSAVQKSGVKDVTKKLVKANAHVTQQGKALTRALGHSGSAGKQIADVAKKLDKALSDFPTEQLAIGIEMGIQSDGSSQ